jgi:hypothetical protein
MSQKLASGDKKCKNPHKNGPRTLVLSPEIGCGAWI